MFNIIVLGYVSLKFVQVVVSLALLAEYNLPDILADIV